MWERLPVESNGSNSETGQYAFRTRLFREQLGVMVAGRVDSIRDFCGDAARAGRFYSQRQHPLRLGSVANLGEQRRFA